jgi:hypothetical protein
MTLGKRSAFGKLEKSHGSACCWRLIKKIKKAPIAGLAIGASGRKGSHFGPVIHGPVHCHLAAHSNPHSAA